MIGQRPLPHSVEAEQGILASMLISPRDAIAEVVDRITPDYFYVPAHLMIFTVFLELYGERKAIDMITITQELRDRGELESVGGPSFLAHLQTFVPTAANLHFYREIVTSKYLAREIIAKCTRLIALAYEHQDESAQAVEETQATLTEIIMQSERADVFRDLKEGALEAAAQLKEAWQRRGQDTTHGLETGFQDFDRMTAGLKPQQLIIVGARPSSGKTALAMNMAVNISRRNAADRTDLKAQRERDKTTFEGGTAVGVFSMEMSYQEISNRVFAFCTGVDLQKFRDGLLKATEKESLPRWAEKIGHARIWIDDTAALTIPSFRARARLMRLRFKVGVIIVDYLQLMRSLTRRSEEARWLEITEISGALKATAKELQIPIICCAQLNREAEQRPFAKPKLSDLRESGSIEQDADIVLLLWRPSRHMEGKEDAPKKLAKLLGLTTFEDDIKIDLGAKDLTDGQVKERDRQIEEYSELIVAKQRNGPVSQRHGIRLRFDGEHTRFISLTKKPFSNREDERQGAAELVEGPAATGGNGLTTEEIIEAFPGATVIDEE